jgi:hypothetical protein
MFFTLFPLIRGESHDEGSEEAPLEKIAKCDDSRRRRRKRR